MRWPSRSIHPSRPRLSPTKSVVCSTGKTPRRSPVAPPPEAEHSAMDRAAAAALAHDRAPDSAVRPQADADAFIHWLLASVEVETSVFHVGQYCGTWHASTAGRALASYHLVLRGECFVHLEGRAPI